jgi:SAM-dependent methyltransferase
MAWPRSLVPFLDGTADFALRPVHGGADTVEATGRFGTGSGPVRFVDPHGVQLIVNKWGNLGHALADYDAGMVDRLLDNLDEVRAVIAKHSDVDVYVTGGTLLGPYRDGRVMPNDDDADLAYLSRHSHPVDVVLEAFRLGRALVAEGMTVIRLSAGHVQLHFEHEGLADGYVDVFSGWIDDGWWYQVFPVRQRVRREQLVPVDTIDVQGRPEPTCREPEVMLDAIYGPGWATPDPAFRFQLPPATGDRMYGWLSDQNMDRETWQDHYRYGAPTAPAPGSRPSDYARWVADRIPQDGPVLDLGAGRGDDTLWFAARGHRVDALDYVDTGMAGALRTAEACGLPVRFRVLNLNDVRRVLVAGAEIAARREPVTVFARGLLGSLVDVARPRLWRLLAMVLRTGGQAHLDVPRESWKPDPGTGEPLHRAVPLDVLAAEMAPYGLRVDETHEAEEPHDDTPWGTGPRVLPTTRMVITWQRRPR